MTDPARKLAGDVVDAQHVVTCPGCGAAYVVSPPNLALVGVLLCTRCGQGHGVGQHATASIRPIAVGDGAGAASGTAGATAGATVGLAPGSRVVVAHADPADGVVVAEAVRRAGWHPVLVASGARALTACHPALPVLPAAVVVDVGLSRPFAFEVIETLRTRRETHRLPIVLLAAVHDRARYRRRPVDLHGADACVDFPDVAAQLPSTLRLSALRKRPFSDDVEVVVEGSRPAARALLTDLGLACVDDIVAGVAAGEPFARLAHALADVRSLQLQRGHDAGVFDDELARFRHRLLRFANEGLAFG